MHDRAQWHDPGHFAGLYRPRINSARPMHNAAPESPKPEIGTMGTELLIVGVTFSFYALCVLFVRICDRI
jgi:hypothetical protein